MRRVLTVLAAVAAFGIGASTAQAQTAGATGKGLYAEFTPGVTVSSATTGALVGGEVGLRLNSSWTVFLEGGRMLNTKSSDLDAAAAIISQQVLAPQSGGNATADAKQPVNYFDVGLRYALPIEGRFGGRVHPYAVLGIGGAKVTRDTTFSVNGTNVNSVLASTYGVQLGGDLSGSESAALLVLGGGAQAAISGPLFLDVSYRYGRVFISGQGVNTNRVQIGIGVRF